MRLVFALDARRSAVTGSVPPRLPRLAPIDELVTADQAARSNLSGLMTIGGQPARTTH